MSFWRLGSYCSNPNSADSYGSCSNTNSSGKVGTPNCEDSNKDWAISDSEKDKFISYWQDTGGYVIDPTQPDGYNTCSSCANGCANGACIQPVVNGVCGSAARQYTYAESWPGTYSYCSTGTANSASPINPIPGTPSTWTCQGQNGGTNASCTATMAAPSYHCEDLNHNYKINTTEASRALAYWRAGGYYVNPAGADGYAPE